MELRSLRAALEDSLRPSYGKCYRLCKENGLLTRRKRPRSVTKYNFHAPESDDFVKHDFTAQTLGTKCLSDITQIKCKDGKLYLAAVLDCYDGAIIGYAMGARMTADLCCKALSAAISCCGYEKDMIVHSDQ